MVRHRLRCADGSRLRFESGAFLGGAFDGEEPVIAVHLQDAEAVGDVAGLVGEVGESEAAMDEEEELLHSLGKIGEGFGIESGDEFIETFTGLGESEVTDFEIVLLKGLLGLAGMTEGGFDDEQMELIGSRRENSGFEVSVRRGLMVHDGFPGFSVGSNHPRMRKKFYFFVEFVEDV